MRFKPFAAVYLILIKDNQILLHLRKGTGFEDGNYSLIAGHLDGNESAKAAMVREAKEEVGITINEENLEFAAVMHRHAPDREYIDFFFACTHWEGVLINTEPHKCGGLQYFPINELPKNTIEYVKLAIDTINAGQKYIEYGWP